MLEMLIAVAIFAALLRYILVSMRREPVEESDADPIAAIDSIRDAMHVEVRESDFAPLATADNEVFRRPRLRAGTTPLPNINQGATK